MTFWSMRACASVITADSGRPWVLASTLTTRSRFRWSMRAGPIDGVTRATWPSGTLVTPSGPRDDDRQRLEIGDDGARLRARCGR